MDIPIIKPLFTPEDLELVRDTINSGWVSQGPRVAEFERVFAAYVGSPYAVAVSNCTTALHLSLICAGVGPGDEVICPSLSFIATANSITYVGARPVFCDVEPLTFNLDPMKAAALITPRTRAILLVHQMGIPARLSEFTSLCERHGLTLIEDAACAIGSAYQGKRIGSHSKFVCFSFHPRKVVTTGEGGMITTYCKQTYERLVRLRQHAMSTDAHTRHSADTTIVETYDEVGFNYRMTDIQAALGIGQIKNLDSILEKRRNIARRYIAELLSVPDIFLPSEGPNEFLNFQSFWIYLRQKCPLSRDHVMTELRKSGVATRRGIMTAHREGAYTKICPNLALPVSEDLSDRSIIIPLYPQMTDDEINLVIQSARRVLNR
jgi:perosamine synthetase